MKKLLVTLIGAAALGAFADTGVWFEDSAFTVGSTQTVAQINTIVGDYMSELPDSTNVYKVAAMGSQAGLSGYPVADNFASDPTKALDVNTTFGKPLSVTNKVAATIGDGVYFDSLVKFTVCEDPMTTEYDGAKIVMWLQEESENDVISGTNLYVKAGFLTTAAGLTGVSNAVYKCEGYGIDGDFADKWHRVTIKAIDDITKDGSGIPGFVIFIDGTGATPNTVKAAKTRASVAKWDSTRTPALNESASFFNADGALFPSMVQSGDAKTSISTASFDGTGAINMLLFTTTAPAFADDYRAPKGGYKIGSAESVDFYDLAELEGAINGYYQTSGDPVTISVTFTKGFEVGAPIEFTSNPYVGSVVIDFNGCVITNTSDYYVITNSANGLVLMDSVGTGGIRCTSVEETAGAVYKTTEAALKITGGNYWGKLKFEGLPSASSRIEGGSFMQSALEIGAKWIASGKALVADGQDWYTIVDAFTVTFVVDDEPYGVVNNVATNTIVPNAKIPEDPEKEGFEFAGWSPDPSETLIVSNTTFTAEWTANNYTVKFISGEGSYTQEVVKASGEQIAAGDVTAPVSVTGKDFTGWDPAVKFPITVTGNATYTAQYAVQTFTVRFFNGGSQIGADQTVNYGEKATAPEAPTKDGYTFTDWTPSTNDAITAATDFAATWSLDSYMITFNANGGSVDPATTNFTIESGEITLPTPTIVGSTFDGWTNETVTVAIKTFTPAAGNLENFTLYAKWTPLGPVNPTIDPASDTAVVPAKDGETAEQAEARVEIGITSDVAAALTTAGVSESTYQGYFSKTAVKDGDNWNVTAKFTDTVETAVATAAEAVVNGTATTVTIPAGLYYKVTTYTALGGTPTVAVSSTLSTGAASSTITKPGTTQGFIKVEIDTAPIK